MILQTTFLPNDIDLLTTQRFQISTMGNNAKSNIQIIVERT